MAILVTACFVAIVLRLIDIDALGAILKRSNPFWLGLGVLATVATTTLRSLRLGVLVDGRLDPPLLAASIMHNASAALLPMKLGEFVLPMLLSRLGRMPVSSGLGVLALLRALDMLALLLVGSLAAYIGLGSMAGFGFGSKISLAVFAAVAITIPTLLLGWNRIAALVRSNTLLARIPILLNMVLAMTGADRRRVIVSLAISILIWLALFAGFYCFSHAVNIDIGFASAATIGAVASLAFAFPISGIANVGPFQTAWVWMSMHIGISSSAALAASLIAHGSIVAMTSLMALLASPLLVGALRVRRTPDLAERNP